MMSNKKKQQLLDQNNENLEVDHTKHFSALKGQSEIDDQYTQKKTKKKMQTQRQEYSSEYKQQNYSNPDKVDSLQNCLQKANEQNQILYQKIYQLESDITDSKQLIQKLQNDSKFKNQQMDQLNFRFEDSGHSDEKILSNARFNSQTLMMELEHRDREIKRLQEIINERNDKLKVITILQEKDLDKCLQLSKKIKILEQENLQQKEEINDKNYENNQLITKQMAEGTFKVELDHLRADVKRLVKMLKQTNEFKDFALIADDEGEGIRFLKDIKIKSHLDSDITNTLQKPNCHVRVDEFIDEKMLWCPEEAWKFAHEFRQKYKGEMTQVVTERLIFELNKIWSKREKIIAKQIRNECTFETAALRRQLNQTQKYDEHQSLNTIKRLKNDVKQNFKENMELFFYQDSRYPPGAKFVKETIKMSETTAKAYKDSDEYNKILKQQLSLMENQSKISNDQGQFMQGAVWMHNKIQQDSKELNGKLKKSIKQYQNKKSQISEKNKIDKNLLINETDQVIEKIQNSVDIYLSQIKGYKSQEQDSRKRPSSTHVNR